MNVYKSEVTSADSRSYLAMSFEKSVRIMDSILSFRVVDALPR